MSRVYRKGLGSLAILPVVGALMTHSATLLAQSPNTASLVVRVSDQTAAALPAAEVSVQAIGTGLNRHAVTGNNGTVTIVALPLTGVYRITVSKPDFSPKTVDATLRAGETSTVQVTLVASGGTSQVTVYGAAEGVRADPELGTRLPADEIRQIPVLGRKISYLPLIDAAFRQAKGTGDLFLNSVYVVTGAGGRRQTDYVIDGATGDEPWGRQAMFSTIPVGAIQEMNVLSSAFSAEFGWTSGAAVNIVTKGGSNQPHGETILLGRPGGLQPDSFSPSAQCPASIPSCVSPAGAAASISQPDIPDSLLQGSTAIGGPIKRDRTFYFFASDLTRQDRTAAVTTPLVPQGTSVVGNYRQALADGRIDHHASNTNTLTARLNLDRFYDTNPQDAVSGNVLPSAGRQFTRHAYGAQLNDTAVLSGTMVNEARLEYQNADPVTAFDPQTPSTQLTRAGALPFTSGESRFAHVFSRVAQVSDTLSVSSGRHYVRLGGNITRNTSGGDGTEFGSAFTLGQFTVNSTSTKPVDQLSIGDVQQYQQSFNLGAATYELGQWIGALFAQDSYRAGTDLTLDLGLRYDRQTFSDGKKNFEPRIGFGWNPGGSSKTAVRGGYGIYYTLLRGNIDASFALGGPTGIFTYTAVPGQTGFPACLACTPVPFNPGAAASTLPARDITIRPGQAAYYSQFFDVAKLPGYPSATFVNPRSQVGSIGVEHELAPGLHLSADYVWQHWTGLDRTVDLNAPSLFVRTVPRQVRPVTVANATRPIVPVSGGFRQINVVENLGVADYNGLQTMMRWQSERALVSVTYTLSKATNTTEPDGNAAGPNDVNQLGEEERGPSLLDQRHRAVATVSYRVTHTVTAGTVVQAASARPFNPTTGLDNNGDGLNNDRPVIDGRVAGRYSFRGTATSDIAVFAEGAKELGGRRLSIRVEAFNLFNHANVLGRNGTYGDSSVPLPTFGQALDGLPNVDAGRMVQLQAGFSF